jgi:dTDP-4-amino-4,6-dideoxygalactose transaminase
LLPDLAALEPYLREIDGSRVYSNFGPLVERFEARLGTYFGLPDHHVVTVANGTLALAATLMAVVGERDGYCLLPSWTFCASAHAAVLAGLDPFFADVDSGTWQLRPDTARALVRRVPEIRAVIVVAPFGMPVDAPAWDAFAEETGVPVVIDAAAAFAGQKPSRAPCVFSLHATKILGVGEGACVTSLHPDLAGAVRRVVNFGFLGTRVSEVLGMNGKLSEYAAAVGLAALDSWPQTRAKWLATSQAYRARLSALRDVVALPSGADALSTTMVVELHEPAVIVEETLARYGIATRRWWRDGCHREPAFAQFPSEALPVTERLASFSIGLPMAVDLTTEEIDAVTNALQARDSAHDLERA